jgi:catalase-peroxidase
MVSKKNLKKNKISEYLYTSPTKSLCPFQSSSDHSSSDKSTCPVKCTVQPGSNIYPNYNFWPSQIDLRILQQNNSLSNPMDKDFDYVKEFNSLNLQAVKQDLANVMITSQDWWPADFGNYGPFIVRMTWHSAGTYRSGDGRGGAGSGGLRFSPLNSWPDNANLDKARRLIWPVKQKYGSKISWADLMVLAGNVALEIMGFKLIGYAGGRNDVWETDYYTNWGCETKMLEDNKRYSCNHKLKKPLAATEMGLIYVNPEGPDGNPDPIAAAHDIRVTFGRMGMNDEETVALIAGGHTIGKCHGAASTKYLGPAPEAAPIQEMNFGWKNCYRTGKGPNTITSGLELTWTDTPTKWSITYLKYLFEFEWKLMKSPAGAYQWVAKNAEADIPDAFDPSKKQLPMMLTTDLSLRFDSKYGKISKMFLHNPEKFADAFANAWFKLTHRDMGPRSRYLGNEVPKQQFLWQDPIPLRNYPLVTIDDINFLKVQIKNSGLTVYELVYTAWSSASTFRNSDKRGGANGARIRLLPQKYWTINQPSQLSKVLSILESIQTNFNNKQTDGTQISLADMIVLAGAVGIEQAALAAGIIIIVPFTPGRMDASQEQTDIHSFNLLKPKSDGFRNYQKPKLSIKPEVMLIDKAEQLTLTAPQMTVLLGGLRTIGINFNYSSNGVLTNRPGTLTTDFFINILSIDIIWKSQCKNSNIFKGFDRNTGKLKWSATRFDLIFGSNSILRAYCEVYASYDAQNKFINDFIEAWNKVMNADIFYQV